MRRDLPSLSSLEAFEAAARHRSFTRAALDLHVTQGAVSRQVQALEGQLGVALFDRVRKRISLSPAGEAYLPKVRACLERLEAATLQMKAFKGASSGVLNLAILPTFGTRWLIPRLPAFMAAHPEALVNFTTRLHVFDFAEEDLDAAIHSGRPDWPGTVLDHLMDEEVEVMGSPALCRKAGLKRPADVESQVLLQLSSRPLAWREWLDAAALLGVDGRRGPRFEHFAMVIQAAMAGLGLAVLPRFLVEDELRTRQLVVPFRGTTVRSGSYWLAYPEAKRDLPALVAFRDWLLAEIRSVPARP
jgi:LysR family transcriptional regulator, glycine cleavage system transcriptional activator